MSVGQVLRLSVNTIGTGANYGQLVSVQASVPGPSASGQLMSIQANTVDQGGARGEISRLSATTPTLSRAGDNQSNIEPYTTVTLTGSDLEYSDADRLWTQTSGPRVLLVQGGKTATFRSPGSMTGVGLEFSYQVAGNLPATTAVTVQRSTEFKVVGGVLVPCRMMRVVA